jgi:hypothetical protein
MCFQATLPLLSPSLLCDVVVSLVHRWPNLDKAMKVRVGRLEIRSALVDLDEFDAT